MLGDYYNLFVSLCKRLFYYPLKMAVSSPTDIFSVLFYSPELYRQTESKLGLEWRASWGRIQV